MWARDDAIRYFEAKGERYKAKIIAGIPATETLSVYRQGKFRDLCRGPHLARIIGRFEQAERELQ